MPQFPAVTVEEQINTITAAAPTYMKGFSDLTYRGHALWALMNKYGMIERGASEYARFWQVKATEPDIRVGSDTVRQTFQNHNPYKNAQIDVRDYVGTDLLTEAQYKKTRGSSQLIDLYEQKMDDLGMAAIKRIQEWIYQDGDSSDYQDGFNGFESCLGDDGGTVVGDRIALPSDTYAGLSTALGQVETSWTNVSGGGAYNASLSNDWPYGQGKSGYDYYSPLLVNWGSSGWTTAGSWSANCDEVLRFASTVMRSRNGYMNIQGAPMINLLAPNLYEDAENFYTDRFRIVQPFAEATDLGFAQQKNLYLDGTVLVSDYGVPYNTGYGLCPSHIEAFFLKGIHNALEDSVIDAEGPAWSIERAAYLFRITVFGNLRLQPKFMVKYYPYASS